MRRKIAIAAVVVACLSLEGFAETRPIPRPIDPPAPGRVVTTNEQLMSEDAPQQRHRASALAGSCTNMPAPCNQNISGSLEVGDCVSTTDGTFYDVYTFAGTAGQVVTATLRPQTSTYKSPVLFIAPPSSDASSTPLVYGGTAGTVTYQLGTTGSWHYLAGTTDLFSHGAYILSTECENDTLPATEQACIDQNLLCNQTLEWSLSNQSCTFANGPQRLFAPIDVWGVVGDVLRIDMVADFPPNIGVYRNGSLVSPVAAITTTTASITFVVPSTGWYLIAATSQVDRQVGRFSLKMTCTASGCLWPLITQQPSGTSVPYNGRATLTVAADAVSAVRYDWYESDGGLPSLVATTTDNHFVTPPLTSPKTYFVEVTNACGSAMSNAALVTVESGRRRAVRH